MFGKKLFRQQARPGADLAHQNGLLGDLSGRNRTLLGQRVIRRGDDDLGMVANECAFDPNAFGRTPHYCYIESSALECGDRVLTVADDKFHVDIGMSARERREHLWSEILRCRNHAHGDTSAGQCLESRETGSAVSEDRFDSFRCCKYLAAGRRQRQTSTVSLDEWQPDDRLKLMHLHGDGGWRDVTLLRRGGQAAAMRRRAKQSELLDGDVSHSGANSYFLNGMLSNLNFINMVVRFTS